MRVKIILRLLDRSPFSERFQMSAEEIVVESIRVVPVELATLIQREGGEVLVVCVHVDERDRRCSQQLGYVSRDGGFAGARTSSDSDDQRFQHLDRKLRCPVLERIMPLLTADSSAAKQQERQ